MAAAEPDAERGWRAPERDRARRSGRNGFGYHREMRTIVGVFVAVGGIALGSPPAHAAEAICTDPAVIYCNDFEAGWDGIDAEPDSTIVDGLVQSDLDADGDGASWDYR